MKNNYEKNFFGKNIRFLLDNPRTETAPQTQLQLANKCQFSEGKLSRIINNNVVSEEDALKISGIFNIPLSVLIKDDLEKIEKSVHSKNNISNFVELLIEQTKKGIYSWSKHSGFEVKNHLNNVLTLYNISDNDDVFLVTEEQAIKLEKDVDSCTYFEFYYYHSDGVTKRLIVKNFYLSSISKDTNLIFLKGTKENSDDDVLIIIVQSEDCEQVICEKDNDNCTIPTDIFDELNCIIKMYTASLHINHKTKETIKNIISRYKDKGA